MRFGVEGRIVEMGLHGDLSAQQRESLERIGRSASQLRGLIEDVLSIARIEAGHVEVSTAAVRLLDVIKDVETLLGPPLHAKPQTLSFTNCDAGLTAYATRRRFGPRSRHRVGIPRDKTRGDLRGFVQLGRSLRSPQKDRGCAWPSAPFRSRNGWRLDS